MNLLTIISVLGPNDKLYIQKNIDLIKNLNGSKNNIKIELIDNFPDKGEIIFKDHKNITINKGVNQTQNYPRELRGSYQHGDALNQFFKFKKINTKYLLILDPDFFIILPKWINKIINYMEYNNLDFFGAPWNPKWFTKYRYFPCIHCIFINTRKINIQQLDFSPKLINKKLNPQNYKVRFSKKRASNFIKKINYFFFSKFLHKMTKNITSNIIGKRIFYLLNLLVRFTFTRRLINSSKDTGYLLNKRFANKNYSYKIVSPILYHNDYGDIPHLNYKFGLFIEKLIPNIISYIPKSRGYLNNTLNFNYFNLPNINKRFKWEEFIWENKPFGFHIRKSTKKSNLKDDFKLIDEITRINDLIEY